MPAADEGTFRDIRRLLAVVAHPDDESFGLGAVVSTLVDRGVEVSVLSLTAGEASTLGAVADLADLAVVRRAEMRAAAAVLGVSAVVASFADGSLGAHAPRDLELLIERHLHAAQALLIFEPNGVTGHPDHRAASLAAGRVARRHSLPVLEWGLPSAVARRLVLEFGIGFRSLRRTAAVVEIEVDRTKQWAAIREHRSQQPGNPVLERRLALQGPRELLRVHSTVRQGRRLPERDR